MQSQSQVEIPPGTLVHKRYHVVRTIGRGGMGAVYEAVDQRLGNTVALKQMLVSGPTVTTAFEREARILAGLRHPALPRVTDFFSEPLGQFLVMEYIPGTDLGTLLAQRGRPFFAEESLPWADQTLRVLEYLHVQQPPIIHRDIKPQNLKLTPGGEIVLLDFGLAKNASSVQTTTTGSIFAYTPTYAPLEQVQGSGTTTSSDLYALAATLHHLLTGTPPPDVLQRVGELALGQPDPLRPADELNPLVPPALSAWLLRGLQIEPSRRPASAAAMRAALPQPHGTAPAAATDTTRFVGLPPPHLASPGGAAMQPTIAAPSSSPQRQPAPNPRRAGPPLALIGLAAALLLIAAIGLGIFLGGRQSADPTPTAAPVPAQVPSLPAPLPSAAQAPPLSQPLQPPTAPPAGPAGAQPGAPGFGPLGAQIPTRVSASGAASTSIDARGNRTTFDAANVTDGRPDTAWRVEGAGRGQFVQLEFAQPVRVQQVQVIPGYAKIDPDDGTDRFLQNRRVSLVRLEFSDGSTLEATFDDLPAPQAVVLPQPIVTTFVRIVILETRPGVGPDPRDFTPLSEVVVVGEAQIP